MTTTTTTLLDLDALEAKARAATPGPYRVCTCGKCGLIWSIPADAVVTIAQAEMEDMPGFTREQRSANAEYVVAASPDVVLALIAENRQLRAERARRDAKPRLDVTAEDPLLHLWHDGSNYVVAVNSADASELLGAHLGEPVVNAKWRAVPDDYELSLLADAYDRSSEVTRKTAAKWVKSRGRGYLGSADF